MDPNFLILPTCTHSKTWLKVLNGNLRIVVYLPLGNYRNSSNHTLFCLFCFTSIFSRSSLFYLTVLLLNCNLCSSSDEVSHFLRHQSSHVIGASISQTDHSNEPPSMSTCAKCDSPVIFFFQRGLLTEWCAFDITNTLTCNSVNPFNYYQWQSIVSFVGFSY